MNPDKLFDYLDGKLSPADREALEDQLIKDPQLQREFAVAREIHRSTNGGREVIVPSDDLETQARGAKLGRRIALAAIVLIGVNVVVGLGVIGWKNRKPSDPSAQESAIRRQLELSLGAAGNNALPAPSLSDDEIRLAAPKAQWENLAAAVTTAAEACGGSAIQDASETGVTVSAFIPRARLAEFKQRIVGTNASPPPAASASAGESVTVQVRIAETAQ